MEFYYGRVVLLTGASSGIGKIAAEHLAGLGYRVYGTSARVKMDVLFFLMIILKALLK